MKSLIIFAGGVLVLISTSCKSKEEETAQKTVDRYVIFVDSVNKVEPEKRELRWDRIMEDYKRKRSEAETALAQFKEGEQKKEQERIEKSNSMFEGIMAVKK